MPRKYERKINEAKGRDDIYRQWEFLAQVATTGRLLERGAVLADSRKDFRVLLKKIEVLRAALRRAKKINDPVAYSESLQGWLNDVGLTWPLGVFVIDPWAPRSGRVMRKKTRKRARKALRLHEKGRGYQAIGRRLLPEVYQHSPKQAADSIRDLIAQAERERIRTPHFRDTWRALLGGYDAISQSLPKVDRLPEQAKRKQKAR